MVVNMVTSHPTSFNTLVVITNHNIGQNLVDQSSLISHQLSLGHELKVSKLK